MKEVQLFQEYRHVLGFNVCLLSHCVSHLFRLKVLLFGFRQVLYRILQLRLDTCQLVYALKTQKIKKNT